MADSARVRAPNRDLPGAVAPRPANKERARGPAYRPAVVVRRHRSGVPPALRQQMIQEAAYRRAESRGFAPGGELADWLAAEAEVDEIIATRYQL